MTTRINILSENVISKIAAGEVVERPASVVKELVENSLDAGAEKVTVEIGAGGRQSIVVSDNGSGMSREDTELCVERHATSKMSGPADLFDIDTLGFRGEALASIAAASRMTIDTRLQEEQEGTRLVIEGGIRRQLGAAARDVGTSIAVRSLFFNTPARRKFLRHAETEARYVTQTVIQLASAYPAVAFQLRHEERTTLDLRSGSKEERAADILGLPVTELLHATTEQDGITAQLWMSTPAECRKSRAKQFCVVRQRPVHSRDVNQSIYSGFGGLLPHGRHPLFVLWLDLDPRQVDVNVHPTKREVKLSAIREVREAVSAAAQQALEIARNSGTVFLPQPMLEGSSMAAEPRPAFLPSQSEDAGGVICEATRDWQRQTQMSLALLAPSQLKGTPLTPQTADSKEGEGGDRETLSHLGSEAGLWQVHSKYILSLIPDGLIVIDQHVAHERVRFEEVLDRMEAEGTSSQQLLFPIMVELSPVEMDAFAEAREHFAKIGFGIEALGPKELRVESVPAELKSWSDGEIFHSIISELLEEIEIRPHLREAVAASMACHTSIRAGERLSSQQMKTLIERLLQAREPFVCPHGRPIFVKIPLREFDKLFGRT
jgi:DNA mismatch repair protein MutL